MTIQTPIQMTLFNEIPVIPTTEGIKYAGSKLKLLPFIMQLIQKISPKTVLDGFSGTTRVSQALARAGYQVVSNDIAVWSDYFARCYLLSDRPREHYSSLIEHLNNLKGQDGWFTEHYGADNGRKRPWQIHNTRKLDAIREEIDKLKLTEIDKAVAITSLILALDQVDSTLGHYASYLREWSPRSFNKLRLRVPMLIQKQRDHAVYNKDIFNIVDNVKVDVAYYDPPYGSNNEKMPPSRVRYASYYHVWTTICLNDKPQLFGKANRRTDSSDVIASSLFEEFRRGETGRFVVVEAIEELLVRTQAQFIILSYSSGGRATAQELNEAIRKVGRLIETIEVDYKRNVMADMCWTNDWIRDSEKPNREFLFLIEKR